MLLLVTQLVMVVAWLKRVRLTRKTHGSVAIVNTPDQGALISKAMGKDCAPLPLKEWGGEAGVPRNLFPRIGVG